MAALESVRPKVLFAVPYALKLLAESERTLKLLAECKAVSSSGSGCPDQLGNRLVEAGVNLFTFFGT